ncbi:hypothetical protein MIND_01386300 [Mycena indigotica]|uniref:Uncharacterized protein n=1 Tax=Mycena indigotica TaxID=2126181 RepID=A0A8H6VT98_9AGAR|nr:uncharacterized protein MIND_01386300 [Mycena indigotica]KAF7289248.1 hypothetical protein MIND_01386300 [Mycena indigotica]
MIVTESTPKTPPKSNTPLLGESSAPPAYAPRGPSAGPSGPYIVYQQQPLYPQRPPQSAGKRFLKAFLVAVGIWVLASALLGSIFSSRRYRHYQMVDLQATYPVPDNVELDECVTEWTTGPTNPTSSTPYTSLASFSFPIPSKTLLLLSKGSLSGGRLKVVTSASDDVKITVAIHYADTLARELAKVCLINRDEGEQGVGLFTPTEWRGRPYSVSFDVELSIPRSQSNNPQFINALLTDVNNFSQEIDSLQDVVVFDTLTLQGSNGGIRSPSLVATNTIIKTSNARVAIGHLMSSTASVRSSGGGITGTYVTKGPLNLITSNGAIDVSISVTSDTDRQVPVLMTTSNAQINAVVDLISTSNSGGSFLVQPKTSNGRLTTTIKSLPIDGKLKLEARTSNSLAQVALPLTYEGGFSLATSNAATLVQRRGSSERDPKCPDSGECEGQRSRTVSTRMVRKTSAAGVVHWDAKNAQRGDVSLKTSNGGVTLVL